jgi:hypothetical protein
MKRSLIVSLSAVLVLASCGGGSSGWFQSPFKHEADAVGNPLIPEKAASESVFREQVDNSYQGWDVAEVSALRLERRPGGAILRATALADYQGAFDLRLVRDAAASGDGRLVYNLRAIQAPDGTKGSARSRSNDVAILLSDSDLATVRVIEVKAARNRRSVRR